LIEEYLFESYVMSSEVIASEKITQEIFDVKGKKIIILYSFTF